MHFEKFFTIPSLGKASTTLKRIADCARTLKITRKVGLPFFVQFEAVRMDDDDIYWTNDRFGPYKQTLTKGGKYFKREVGICCHVWRAFARTVCVKGVQRGCEDPCNQLQGGKHLKSLPLSQTGLPYPHFAFREKVSVFFLVRSFG